MATSSIALSSGPAVSPTSDLRLAFSDNGDGTVEVDLVVSPRGDWDTVQGFDLLVQNLTLYLLAELGSNIFDPTFGNALIDQTGRPGASAHVLITMLNNAERSFLDLQAVAAASGFLSTDEQLDRIDDPSVTPSPINPGAYTLAFTAVSRAGTTRRLTLPGALTLTAS